MEMSIVSLLVNALLGFIMYLMKINHDVTRQEIKALHERQQHFQEHYMKRDDFRELKQDFNDRFDRFEDTVKTLLSKKP